MPKATQAAMPAVGQSRLKRAVSRATFATLSSAALLGGFGGQSAHALNEPGGYSPDVSNVNQATHSLWMGAWITAGIVGLFTMILILWPAVFHRRKGDEMPRQTQYHIPSEIAYTVIPFIIVAILFAYTAKAENKITHLDKSAPTHVINVTGIQWSWQFQYEDAAAKPIVTGTPDTPPTLVVPQGEKVRFNITSNDVDHGFWIPAFMYQIQAIPNIVNHVDLTANKLGEFPGRCNILCGRAHSQMIFTVKVVTPADYQSYINSIKAA
jgi:cytochrome c oxidase subunit 2